jgi:hypothetical protein
MVLVEFTEIDEEREDFFGENGNFGDGEQASEVRAMREGREGRGNEILEAERSPAPRC